jgi:hypothetical protein
MSKETVLQELLQRKRSYESLLALNSAGKHKSNVIESVIKEHLQGVVNSIENMKRNHHN